jgi:hypothetical protein
MFCASLTVGALVIASLAVGVTVGAIIVNVIERV